MKETTLRSGHPELDALYPRIQGFLMKDVTEYSMLGSHVRGYRTPDTPSLWIRDYSDMMRGFRYCEKDMKSLVDHFAEVQSARGWIFDYFTMTPVRTIGKIHGPVIVELAELDTVRRAGTEAMKAFIDESVDRVQWLYARTQVDVPRSCVFAGTSNDSSYLKDATGNRRYWPIACSHIDLEARRAEREQLWAEAAAAYRAGAVWWPASEMIGELAELQESRRAVSAAEETISSVLEATYTPGLHVLSGAVLHANQVLDGKLLWVTTTQLCALAKCKDFEVQTAMHAIKWKMGRVRLLTGQRIRAYMREVNEGTGQPDANVLRTEPPRNSTGLGTRWSAIHHHNIEVRQPLRPHRLKAVCQGINAITGRDYDRTRRQQSTLPIALVRSNEFLA